MSSLVIALSCSRCGRRHDHRVRRNVCTCGSPLLVDYDLDGVRAAVVPSELSARSPDMWRYREMLPLEDPARAVTLGEGMTPLLAPSRLRRRFGLSGLLVKDEGGNPTATFKARGAACGVSRARELGIDEVALATAGNAGGAWAAYGAAAGVRVHVAMPNDAPEAAALECRLHGADVEMVEGSISDAGGLVARRVEERGWFDVSTLKEPYRVEGKKTLGYEIAEQLGWRAPDAIVYPAGGGVGLIGIWLAMRQLAELGWLRGEPPRLIVTQPEGCAPLVRALDRGAEESEPWKDATTVAAGLRVPKPFGDFLVLQAVRDTGGTAIAVPDGLILEMMGELGRTGISACPEGAATLAAAALLRDRGDLSRRDRVVLINTGSALKYPDLLRPTGHQRRRPTGPEPTRPVRARPPPSGPSPA